MRIIADLVVLAFFFLLRVGDTHSQSTAPNRVIP
jgi:hypothetical protein